MAFVCIDEPGIPLIHPGTMLKVEEGQDCAVLCAAEEERNEAMLLAAACNDAGVRHQHAHRTAISARCQQQEQQQQQQSPAGTSPRHIPLDAPGGTHRCGGVSHGAAGATRKDSNSGNCVRSSGAGDCHRPPAPSASATAAAIRAAMASSSTAAAGSAAAAGHVGAGSGCGAAAADGAAASVDEFGDEDFCEGAPATAGDSSSAGDDTETFSELSDPGGTEVVFVREGVAVRPGARSERILGRLSLVKQCGVLFMAWLPYSRGYLQADGTFRVAPAAAVPTARLGSGSESLIGGEQGAGGGGGEARVCGKAALSAAQKADEAGPRAERTGGAAAGPGGAAAAGSDRTLYAVHPIPLSEMRALRRRDPPLGLGCPSLVVVLNSGVTLPPLYFQRGGVKALMHTLKQHVFLLKSATEPHTYLVNDTVDPLSRSLSALQLADVLIGGPPPGASATFGPGQRVVVAADNGSDAAAAAAAGSASPPPAAVTWAGVEAGASPAAPAPASAEWCNACNSATVGRAGALGLGLGLGSAMSLCRAEQQPLPAVMPSVGGFEAFRDDGEAVEGHGGVGDGESGAAVDDVARRYSSGGGAGDCVDDDGGEGRVRQAPAWAFSIVDAINRFVQNVRGTASGWISVLDELDDDGNLYDSYYGRRSGGGDSNAIGGDGASSDDDDDDGGDAGGLVRDVQAALGGSGPPPAAAPPSLDWNWTPPSRHLRNVNTANTASSSGPVTAGVYGTASPGSGGGGDTAAARGSGDAAGGGGTTAATEVGEFELLDSGGCWGEAAAHTPGRRRVRPPPLSAEEWAAMFDAEGRLVADAALRDRVCCGGCAPELRREVWKHLLGMYPRGSTAAQRQEASLKWQREYLTLRQQWQSMVPGQEARCVSWRCHRTAVDKDVRRTDRGHPFFAREGCANLRALRNVLLTHVVYDRDLGYCQGMSDLAAPLLVVMRDEAEAFWAFAAVMERLGANFNADLQGMTLQLGALRRLVQLLDPPLHSYFERRDCLSYYFAFRWLLILFKREFKFEEVLTLWEACWACRRTRNLHLYLAVAVLVQHRRVILSSDLDFDGMLRFSIGLSGRLELQPLLESAEALVGYAGEAGREATAELA